MTLFFDFVIQSASFFITTYFIYSLLGRKQKIAYGLLVILILARLIPILQNASLLAIDALILLIVYDVGPLVFAAMIFASITGGIPMIKMKRKRVIKGISDDIQTAWKQKITAIIVILGSLILGVISTLIFEKMMLYTMWVVTVLGFVLGIIIYLQTSKITKERIILLVGKDKESMYEFVIEQKTAKLTVKDFFDDDRYIIDFIGVVHVIDQNKRIEKDYLYWLATSEQVSIQKPLTKLINLSYVDYLDHFEKYHVKHLWFEALKTGKLEKVKEKLII
ncbi:MAG: hypothetical protein WC992_04745 [Acholeplasmataceae bacterium]|jgi:hypothetical protein|nr:hypothetical protein [Acholeplasmataceae bacterium]